MNTSSTPWYRSRWFWVLGAVLLALRLGYKLWQQEQRPDAATRMAELAERSQALKDQIRASQAAAGSAPVVAAPDSAIAADSMVAER